MTSSPSQEAKIPKYSMEDMRSPWGYKDECDKEGDSDLVEDSDLDLDSDSDPVKEEENKTTPPSAKRRGSKVPIE